MSSKSNNEITESEYLMNKQLLNEAQQKLANYKKPSPTKSEEI